MKIAIPVWQGRVSNVFDFACKLLILENKDSEKFQVGEVSLVESNSLERAARLKECDVDVLICGAISRPLAYMVEGEGIKLYPFITGTVNQVLDAYKKGELDKAEFNMPGCWMRQGRGKRKRCRRGRGYKRKDNIY